MSVQIRPDTIQCLTNCCFPQKMNFRFLSTINILYTQTMLVSRPPCRARRRPKRVNSFFFYMDKYFHFNAMHFFYCVFSVFNLLYFEAQGSRSNESLQGGQWQSEYQPLSTRTVIHICALKQLLPEIQPNVGQEGACSHIFQQQHKR